MPVVGFLNAASPDLFAHVVRAFHRGLNETGFVEGRNVAIDYRWAEGQYDRLPMLAAELVRRQVSVIATGSSVVAALAAKAATTTIPIVFLTGTNPVELGLVTSLSHPGGNITGVTTLNTEIAPKRFEVLRELLPASTIMAVLVNPINSPATVEADRRNAEGAAHALGVQEIHVLQASTERDLDAAFLTLAQRRVSGLVISPDTFFSKHPFVYRRR
jgi:putative tryptophan/tyrosine transport system substrate-binding protein